MALFSLKTFKSPRFELELPDGGVKDYDLYELAERLANLDAREREATEPDPDNEGKARPRRVTPGEHYDGVRRVFELPTEDEAKQAGAFTLDRGMCEALAVEVVERVYALPEKKRFFALMRISSGQESPQAS